MPQVSAGNKTGIYYIIVAGLPWQCTWQRLKDFARNVQPDGSCIEIDHAMVYPESPTSGWVRVKGRETFKKALAHLDGGVLDGKAIIADGRNEGEDTPLPDMASTWSASLPRRHRGSSAASSLCDVYQSSASQSDYQDYLQSNHSSQLTTYASSEADWYYQPTSSQSPMSPTYSTIPYNTQASPSTSTYVMQYSVPTTGVIYAGQMAPSTPVYVQGPQLTYMVPMPYAETPNSPTSMAGSTHYLPPTSPVIKTETRKIIVTQLPHSISTKELQNLLMDTIPRCSTSYTAYAIEDAEVARHSDGTPRGHAFVTLESHHLAKAVIKALDGTKYQKRTIQARFAKEGAEPAKTYPLEDTYIMAPPPLSAQVSGSKEQRKEKKSSKEKDAPRKHVKTKAKRDEDGERGKNRGQEEERGGTPLVVDGSSRRDHRK